VDRLTGEVDAVIHLATAVIAKLIVQNPVHTSETNIRDTEGEVASVPSTKLKYCFIMIR
jgi:hypothetical protein